MKLTPREQALVTIIDWLAGVVEECACTCPIEDPTDIRNRLHCAPSRRRQDSECHGVSIAVTAEIKKRRALRQKGL